MVNANFSLLGTTQLQLLEVEIQPSVPLDFHYLVLQVAEVAAIYGKTPSVI